jgi:hypothetical protein
VTGSWISRPLAAALLGLMALSCVAHLWSVHRDLPLRDPDESTFVGSAVHIASTGDPNPHWFGHPGSTVIYPLAAGIHVWDALTQHGPVLTSDLALTGQLHHDPTPFYVIGRLWTIALSVAALPLVFLVGRRAFNARVGLIAAALWAVLPFPVRLGRVVRTDSAGLFFGLLALLLCLRVLESPRLRWCALAGVSVGLAVASRYFMVALVPVLVAAVVLAHPRTLGRSVRSAGVALASAIGAFALSTPFFFLDWHTALGSLRAENVGTVAKFSPLGNLHWYLRFAIPETMTWSLVVLAAAGVAIAATRPQLPQLLLIGFCATFLAGLSVSQYHEQRWILQMLPVLVLFAAFGLDAVARSLAPPLARVLPSAVVLSLTLIALTAIVMVHPAVKLVDANRSSSTRIAARHWIVAHIRRGSRIVRDPDTVTLDRSRFVVNDSLNLHTQSFAQYQQSGYQYLVINDLGSEGYIHRGKRFSHDAAFYRDLTCSAPRVAAFAATTTRSGWTVSIFRLHAQPPRHRSAAFVARCRR